MASPYPDAASHPRSGCVFCRVLEEDQEVVYRDDRIAAILDIRPLFPGHLLVLPLAHVVTLDQLPVTEVTPLFTVVQRATAAMANALGAEGAFVANNNVVSQSVHHLHIHVVPRRKGDGLRGFFWPRTGYDDPDHRSRVAETLAAALTIG